MHVMPSLQAAAVHTGSVCYLQMHQTNTDAAVTTIQYAQVSGPSAAHAPHTS